MSKINLLPWREERRAVRKEQFLFGLGFAAIVGLGTVFAVHLYLESLITTQSDRNKFLSDEIAHLDSKIVSIKELEKEKSSLISRMYAIETLQTSRPIVVHLFDELVTRLPEGIYLNEIEQKGNELTISGSAQSNARVSNFMRNLEDSEWLTGATLEIIENRDKKKDRTNKFTLKVNQITIDEPEQDVVLEEEKS